MRWNSVRNFAAVALFITAVVPSMAQDPDNTNDYRSLVKQGEDALARNDLRLAARVFQHAVDLNPSSVRAHEGLGVALLRELSSGAVNPSADTDVADRAEEHLKQAAQLSPSAARPLLELADLEALLAEHSADERTRAERYKNARDALTQAISLDPSKPEVYLRLATMERDEFGPVLDQVKARYPNSAGPIPDVALRKDLQQRYLQLVDDAIANAQRASEMNANSQRPLLLLSKLFRQRALLRDTQEQYAMDMHTAADWERQFMAAGGHVSAQK
ncbi:MAG TPA: tetratricopeptide repeat protein [Bryobacteraceae bacterium]|jgi:tetratricopeptide (TPR) repeat protein|nr:tetratricopeptide repeat protein [Bryobacteraceae bacterium]